MGCAGSTPAGHTAQPQPAQGSRRVWAKGVGTSFEFLDDKNAWQLITDRYVIDQLGRLCSHNNTTEVSYDGRAMGNGQQQYRAKQEPDGMIVQRNVATGKQRSIRLVPFFFEFEEGQHHWKPVVDPEALVSLTAVLASSINKTYKYTSQSNGYQGEGEGVLIGEKGLIEQRNIRTQRKRRIRPSPVGPDGKPHFEFLDNDGWKPVPEACVKQLAAVAAGRGDAHYKVTIAAGTSFEYHATLADDGFIVQKNASTGKKRDVRPAPWLGHATRAAAAKERVDSTNGYYRGMREQERGATAPVSGGPVHRAEEFYEPEHVPMGTPVAPVVLEEQAIAQSAPQAQASFYYYQPSVMEPGDPGYVPTAHPGSLYPKV